MWSNTYYFQMRTNWPKFLGLGLVLVFWSAYHHHLLRFRHNVTLVQKVGAFIMRVLYHQTYTHVPCPFRASGSSHEGHSELPSGCPFSLVSSPHFHIAFYSDYLHLVEITDKLLKRATWDGLISHFTGLHTKELRLSFLKVLHVHPDRPRHLQNQSSLYPSTSDDRQNSSGYACSWPQHPQAHIQCAS